MFDHVKFGASDYTASKSFFLKELERLGVAVVSEGQPTYAVELAPKGNTLLCLNLTDENPAHLRLAFRAGNRHPVDTFYRASMAADGKCRAALPLGANRKEGMK